MSLDTIIVGVVAGLIVFFISLYITKRRKEKKIETSLDIPKSIKLIFNKLKCIYIFFVKLI